MITHLVANKQEALGVTKMLGYVTAFGTQLSFLTARAFLEQTKVVLVVMVLAYQELVHPTQVVLTLAIIATMVIVVLL